jgi:hypothetical protein
MVRHGVQYASAVAAGIRSAAVDRSTSKSPSSSLLIISVKLLPCAIFTYQLRNVAIPSI